MGFRHRDHSLVGEGRLHKLPNKLILKNCNSQTGNKFQSNFFSKLIYNRDLIRQKFDEI